MTNTHPTYHEQIGFLKQLKQHFEKKFDGFYKMGNVYQNSSDYSYLSFTTEALKKQKLKCVIILNINELSFSICLSGQNKTVRKKYWKYLSSIDDKRYQLAEDIDESLSIIDHKISKEPDFNHPTDLTEQLEKESFKFMNDVLGLLEE